MLWAPRRADPAAHVGATRTARQRDGMTTATTARRERLGRRDDDVHGVTITTARLGRRLDGATVTTARMQLGRRDSDGATARRRDGATMTTARRRYATESDGGPGAGYG